MSRSRTSIDVPASTACFKIINGLVWFSGTTFLIISLAIIYLLNTAALAQSVRAISARVAELIIRNAATKQTAQINNHILMSSIVFTLAFAFLASVARASIVIASLRVGAEIIPPNLDICAVTLRTSPYPLANHPCRNVLHLGIADWAGQIAQPCAVALLHLVSLWLGAVFGVAVQFRLRDGSHRRWSQLSVRFSLLAR